MMITVIIMILGGFFYIRGKKEFFDKYGGRRERGMLPIKSAIFYAGYFISKRVKSSEKYLFQNLESHRILYGKEEFKFKSLEYFSYKYFFHYLSFFIASAYFTSGNDSFEKAIYLLFIGNILTHYYFENNLKERVRERKEKILTGFFEFSSKFTLLIGVGLSFDKALDESIGNNEFSKYLLEASGKIKMGRSVASAFEEIALACRDTMINQYISCIVQSAKRGNFSISSDLNGIMKENWISRVNIYKKWGEELKTKLIFPMMIIFIGILIIIMAPIILKLNSIF